MKPKTKEIAVSIAANSLAVTALTGAVVGSIVSYETTRTLTADCQTNPRAGKVLGLIWPEEPQDFLLEISDGNDTRTVHISLSSGHLVVNETAVLADDAGKNLTTLSDGTHLIAGAPTLQKLGGYYAGDTALTLACPAATPASIAATNAKATSSGLRFNLNLS